MNMETQLASEMYLLFQTVDSVWGKYCHGEARV